MIRLGPIAWVAFALLFIGGLNWGLIGLFEFNLVAELFGEMTTLSRIVYTIVAIAGIYFLVTVTMGWHPHKHEHV